ncbi:hypothetical protein C8Q79DRAFT_905554 [Trametes meyenii]|nr:hypothetical protein C8Q79DRAFT_905554 [Trametes meyenii]
MFSKTLISAAVVGFGFVLQANAHAIITPALGLLTPAVRADVQRPSAAAECGTVNIAANIDTSEAVQVPSNGTFTVTITNFNGGVDGSREVTQAIVDPTATGSSFPVTLDVLVNGDLDPTGTGSQQLVVQLPVGTVCSGGAAGDKCLASFTTAGKFGNCVVLEQSA